MDNNENKPKKLGLKFNSKVDTKDLASDYINLKSSIAKNTTKTEPFDSNRIALDNNKGLGLTSYELNKRLDVVKKAVKEKEEREFEIYEQPEILNEPSEQQDPEEKVLYEEEKTVEAKIADPIHLEPAPIKEVPKGVVVISKASEESKVIKPAPKLKYEPKLKKNDIFNLLDQEEDNKLNKRRLPKHKPIKKQDSFSKPEKVVKEVEIYGDISVADLAIKMSERSVDVIKELMKLGVMADGNKVLDVETVELLVNTFGHKFKKIDEVTVSSLLAAETDDPAFLKPRPAVVTVMGHVDHGKTSLLDAIRESDVAAKESGGITQNIGAYQVHLSDGHKITFIDTPGHEAFTAMRSRGVKVTDIVILVVAADDGINNQTIEAINHSKAANLPIIVAVNKIDKFDDYTSAVSRIKNEMLIHNLIAEDMGGDVMFVPVSALKKTNIDKLEDAVILLAEIMDLKAKYEAPASGFVLDSKLDRHKGSLTTLIVTRGTLNTGDFVVVGGTYGKVRSIYSDKNRILKSAQPSDPVSIVGLEDVAQAGDKFLVVENEKQAREIANSYSYASKEKIFAASVSVKNLIDPFAQSVKELPLIIKADTQGSLEAILGSIGKINHDEVAVRILHKAVGGINESDLSLAEASGAIVLAFNVRLSHQSSASAKDKVDIRYYSIIYDLLNDVKSLLSGMLKPIIREEYLGNAEIRQVFNITKVGKVAGCYITKGLARRGASMRLLRNDTVIHEGKLKTLKRFKDDVREVKEGFECGIVFENYENIQVNDIVEIFTYVEEKRADI